MIARSEYQRALRKLRNEQVVRITQGPPKVEKPGVFPNWGAFLHGLLILALSAGMFWGAAWLLVRIWTRGWQ